MVSADHQYSKKEPLRVKKRDSVQLYADVFKRLFSASARCPSLLEDFHSGHSKHVTKPTARGSFCRATSLEVPSRGKGLALLKEVHSVHCGLLTDRALLFFALECQEGMILACCLAVVVVFRCHATMCRFL